MGLFRSSTQEVPDAVAVPQHVAIIMDGNGRWAKKRFLPRIAGHHRGVESVREIITACSDRGIKYLTLFAFSSENWRRPAEEVSLLMQLFVRVLQQEVNRMHANGVRFRFVGELARFEPILQRLIEQSQELTAANSKLTLTVAANYGGRWDIVQATQAMLREHPEFLNGFGEDDLAPYLSLSYAPEPDLFIRTGGEQRISNFLLWQLAYTELYFTDMLWPDFDSAALDEAIASFRARERRFGRTSDQLRTPSMKEAVQPAGRNRSGVAD